MTFNPRGIVIHNTGGADRVVFDGNVVKGVLTSRGFRGYTFLHEQVDGQYWTSLLVPMNRPGEHVANHNSEYLGFAIVGEFNKAPPGLSCLSTVAAAVAGILDALKLPRTAIIAHRDVPDNNTDCPGKQFDWATFVSMVLNVRGG